MDLECNVADEVEEDIDDQTTVKNDIDLWHQRMGYINNKYLLKTSKAVRGMENLTITKPSTGP